MLNTSYFLCLPILESSFKFYNRITHSTLSRCHHLSDFQSHIHFQECILMCTDAHCTGIMIYTGPIACTGALLVRLHLQQKCTVLTGARITGHCVCTAICAQVLSHDIMQLWAGNIIPKENSCRYICHHHHIYIFIICS